MIHKLFAKLFGRQKSTRTEDRYDFNLGTVPIKTLEPGFLRTEKTKNKEKEQPGSSKESPFYVEIVWINGFITVLLSSFFVLMSLIILREILNRFSN